MGTLYDGARKRIRKFLLEIYPEARITERYLSELYSLIENFITDTACSLNKWDETDTVLITYGNTLFRDQENPLQTLNAFLHNYLKDEISCVHILPFFPYSSDDGFSVINYYRVDPRLGDWEDIGKINRDFDLMLDLVINHVSSESEWFKNFLKGRSPGKDYFIEADPKADWSKVTRPRNTPLLTKFTTHEGEKHLWTTFSNDQIDLNFSNPWVLYEMLKVLFFYINKGARIIRLDAIAYLWKEPGTSSIHLPQTHRIVRFIRELAELINPDTIILTETNVPDRENLSYFGENFDEAHMIYQFPLPPLLLYTLHTGNSNILNEWSRSIPATDEEATFFNFTASHDGIGVRPAEGLIPEENLHQMIQKMREFGGYVKTKTNPDGTESPYEINITWFDALKGTTKGKDNLQEERFICSQTIMMSLKGIPAFYIHSLIATENDYEGMERTGKYRSINRKNLEYNQLIETLEDDNHPAHKIFRQLKKLIWIRKQQPAFHPNSSQEILSLGKPFFGVKRTHESGETIWSISNITNISQRIILKEAIFPHKDFVDLIKNKSYQVEETVNLEPYQTLWLR
jgi:sucrose phosphorylase